MPTAPPHPAWIEPAEWLGAEGAGAALHLVSPQPGGRLHSQLETGPASMGEKRNGREQASLHPDEAARRGIAAGQTVRLWNARGACLATARPDPGVARGVVVLPTGAWFTPQGQGGLELSGNPNVLTPDIPTSGFGQGCSAHTCLVEIEPHAEPAPDPFGAYQTDLAARAAPVRGTP